ncbi:MAG: Hsp20/alpha crystallin family protein [Methanophagales archaeon]|nr:Hsp20/alpha crystallin family protein [Methanophagales archaeon]
MKDKRDEESIVEGVVDEILPGIGGLVKKLKKTSPEFERRIEETDREIKERLEKGYSPRPRIKYGFSIHTLVREEEKKREVKEEIEREILEPLVDVFDEKNYTKVIAELPGIREDDINVELRGRELVIDASNKERRYRKVIELPYDVKEMKKRYKNGILELEVLKNGA